LRLIIESVPVAIAVADAEGRLLAANRSALALVGADRLESLLGQGLSTRCAPDDRGRFDAFVRDVCRGTAGSLTYAIALPDGTRRIVDTRAVPLSRDGIAPAAFLAATWDVTAGEDRAERLALEEALRQARADCERLANDWAAERRALGASLGESRSRLRAALTEADAEHAEAASRWAAEREALAARAREAEEREAALNARLAGDRVTWQKTAAQAEQAYHAEFERLHAQIRELEHHLAQVAEENRAERAAMARLRATEDERAALAARCRQERRTELAELLAPLTAVHARIERMLADDGPSDPDRAAPVPPADPDANGAAEPAPRDEAWGF
jgi:PAS domain S-box-containing protein